MTIAELCVKRPVFAVMLIGFLLVLGIFSFRDLGVDLFPKADPPVVSVSVKLPGRDAGRDHHADCSAAGRSDQLGQRPG